MKTAIVDDIKKFNWKKILEVGNSLDDLNDSQWRFLKATIIEKTIEKYGIKGIKYVAEKHRDFVWKHHKIDLEVKSVLSSSMYKKNGEVRKNFNIMFNNSMGTNSRSIPEDHHVANVILCVYNDGSFIVDGKKFKNHMKSNGDGFTLSVSSDDIIEISGKIPVRKRNIDFKDSVLQKIEEII